MRSGCAATAGLVFALSFGTAAWGETPSAVDYNRDIRPILSERCYACHGPDARQRKADLRLDTQGGLFKELDGGYKTIVAGKPDDSELMARIVSDDDQERMPPPKSGPRLSDKEIGLIRRWIDQGAVWQGHWAFIKPLRHPVPAVSDARFVRNEIDPFVLEKQRERGMSPSPEADRPTLIRRLSFDLIGLPPTPAEVEAFVNDRRADAYERLVDRLLASPHYGERMSAYWLDQVRYADTTGYHGDNHRDIWMYRDYVIRAFNRNKPFDRFTTEQLAGDLMPEATIEDKIASGYNHLLMTTREGGAQAKEYIAKYAADRVRNVSEVWLGATLGCAECHDHKFDPFTTKEFYGFEAFFADLKETAVGEQEQTMLPSLAAFDRMADVEAKIVERTAVLEKAASAAQREEISKEIQLLKFEKQSAGFAIYPAIVSVSIAPRTVRLLPRGNWLDETGPVVSPEVPKSLGSLDISDRRPTRLDLAQWLTSRDNPLTARVFVNRLWKQLFGRGLVATADDFGAQGTWPTHPALLDRLAVEFIESGWDVKRMVRLMALSGTYRQSSATTERSRQQDPDNVWLARQGRFRLDAEQVRDLALSASGLLVPALGGPNAKPYQPAGYWFHLNFPKREYEADHGQGLYRRGLYTYWCRTFLHPSLRAFDASTREECEVDRPRSNTPLQALVLLNDPTYVEAARILALRLVREAQSDDGPRLDRAFRLLLSRPASAAERSALEALLSKHRAHFRSDSKAAITLVHVGEAPVPSAVDAVELAAWTSVVRVVLNLHETITRQ